MTRYQFKGKGKYTNEWVYGGISFEKTNVLITYAEIINGEETGYYLATPVIPESVGQYIWLKDKNGVEMYEGDRYTFDDNDCDGYKEYNNGLPVGYVMKTKYGYGLSVEFASGGKVITDSIGHIENKRVSEHIEVIGNIHDEIKWGGGIYE